MANVSLLASDGVNPQASLMVNTINDEVGKVNVFSVKLEWTDFTTHTNTYVVGKLPVGAIITGFTQYNSVAFSNGFDVGITDVDGTAGTDGDVDVLADDTTTANHAAGLYTSGLPLHASNNFPGHVCVTDSYVTVSATTTLTTSGTTQLFIEYICPL